MKIICRYCSKKFEYNNTYRLCDEGKNGEIAICFPCLELIWKKIISICKEREESEDIKDD